MKKLFALVLALVMVMSLATTAFAATTTVTEGVTGEASIKVTLPTVPEGTDASNTYKIYKVFDATTVDSFISYTLVDGKTTAPAGFTVDGQGNVTYAGTEGATELTDTDIAAIAAYVTEADLVATVVTNEADKEFTVTGLPYGYYYITTTTGTVVTVDSTNPNAEVNDKNTVPEVDKKITGASSVDEDGKKALAQVGTDVTYTGYITVGTGAENYIYHDTMGTGLTFKADSVTIKADSAPVDADDYTLDAAPTTGETFTIAFDNEYIATLAKGTVIAIEYKATINTNALSENPEKNTAYLTYGHTPGENKTPVKETEVYNAKITVNKTDGDGEPLAGAGFVLQNAAGAYYKYTAATETAKQTISWYTLEENETLADAIKAGKVTEYTSNEAGKVQSFIGLPNGTYTLIENTVPAGYNKAADKTFTIAAHNYTATNLEQSATVENNAGTELPSTGGMGTTLFYVLGTMLVLGSAVLLITKKRMIAE